MPPLASQTRRIKNPHRSLVEMETWEQILLGVFALLLLMWIFPGVKTMLERSKQAPQDWSGFLLPIGLVVALVIFLAATL